MTPDELAVLTAQQQLRAELEEQCKKQGWSLDDVFYSNIEFYADTNRSDFQWPETWPARSERPGYASDATRQRPAIALLRLSRPRGR